MRRKEFAALLERIEELTPAQRATLSEKLLEGAPDDKVLNAVNVRVDGNPSCPHCGHKEVGGWGQRRGIRRLRCRSCGKTFNALTATPLARLHHRETWAQFAEAMKAGLSVREAGKLCGVHYTTAFRWRHRWLAAPRDKKQGVFTGIVEADETFFLESQKGSRVWTRAARGECEPPDRLPRRRGGSASKRGVSGEQVPVLVVRDRHGTTADAVLPGVTKEALRAVLRPIMSKDTLLCTDGLRIYRTLAKEEGFAHQPVNVSSGCRVKDRVFHIQHVNAYHSRLKGWLRQFNGVATRYLSNYLGWRRMLEHGGDMLAPLEVLSMALG